MICEHCHRPIRVAVEMEPGTGTPWWLCRRCYVDGLRLRPPPDKVEPKT